MTYQINQIIPPKEMPLALRVRYDIKLSQFGVKRGKTGVRYDGIQEGHKGRRSYQFTMMDEVHPTFCVPEDEMRGA